MRTVEKPTNSRAAQAADAALQPRAVAKTREWWMLVHQLPPEPPGLRMRIWRRLQELGALQIKGSVYVLPATEAAREDLQWLAGEIRAANAEASLWRACSIDGLSDDDLILRFQTSVAADYEALEAEALELRAARKRKGARSITVREAGKRLARLRAAFDEAGRRDYFDAARREIVGALLAELDQAVQESTMPPSAALPCGVLDVRQHRGRTWITRAKVRVDRMASAWLIRRFIDPQARFLFIADAGHPAVAGGLRFDMFGGEFTHEGDRCTFETLLQRFALRAAGLQRIGQIVHDIDLKESRYQHPETAGIAASFDAIADSALNDDQRTAMAATLLDGLLNRFAAGGNSSSPRKRSK